MQLVILKTSMCISLSLTYGDFLLGTVRVRLPVPYLTHVLLFVLSTVLFERSFVNFSEFD